MNGRVIRAEKHKWDGRVSSDSAARLVAAPRDAVAWYVAAGSERRLPSKSASEQVTSRKMDEPVFARRGRGMRPLAGRHGAE